MRLLDTLSPDLLTISFDNLLESLRTSSDLCLPLGLAEDASLEDKLRAGRNTTALRLIEVAEVQADLTEGDSESIAGWPFGAAVLRVLNALHESHEKGSGGLWEDGLRRILEGLRTRMYLWPSGSRANSSFRLSSVLWRFLQCHFSTGSWPSRLHTGSHSSDYGNRVCSGHPAGRGSAARGLAGRWQ